LSIATIPAMFGLIWFSGFRGEDLNVIFYQNVPNLHNWYKSAERKISQKKPEYMLNYSLQWTIKISSPIFFLCLAWRIVTVWHSMATTKNIIFY
jgi:hypothetical protein